MFTLVQLLVIRGALLVQRASFVRLANRAGQPESVVIEYRKNVANVDGLIAAVDEQVAKGQKK